MKRQIFCLSAILVCASALAQDVLYLKDGNKISCDVAKIAGKKLEYKMTGSGEQTTADLSQLLMTFFKNGDYLVFSEMSDDGLNNVTYKAKEASGTGVTQDIIISKDEKVFVGKVNAVETGQIKYTPKGSILAMSKSTADVAVIIFTSGKHQLFTSPAEAAPVLSAVKSRVNSYIAPIEGKSETEVSEVTPKKEQTTAKKENEPVKEKDVAKEKKEIKPEKKEEVVKESVKEEKTKKEKEAEEKAKTEKPKEELAEEVQVKKETIEEVIPAKEEIKKEEPKAETKETVIQTEPEEKKPTVIKEEEKEFAGLDIDFEMFKRKSLQKVEDLGAYISIIADKNTEWQESNKAIDLACTLFVNEEANVEVSSKGSPEKTKYKIRPYLNRIKLLKYDRVEVSWTNISYVSDLRKGVDGNYYGVITLQQVFTGFIEGKVAYTDVTKKNIEVVLKGYEKLVEGKTIGLWDVFLSDIGVVVTS